MASAGSVQGRVTYRGAGQADAEVLAVDAEGQVLASAPTDQAGAFTLDPPGSGHPARLFARCRGPVAGIATTDLDPDSTEPIELRMDAHAPAFPLEVRLAAGDAPPREPFVRLLPLAVAGVAPETMRLVVARVGEASPSALETDAMADGVLRREVQAGQWWFRVDLSESWEARPAGSAANSARWTTVGASTSDGTKLAPERGGYVVDVAAATKVTVQLSPAPPRS